MARDNMTVFQKALLQSVLDEYRDIAEESELEDNFSANFKEWANDFIKQQTPQKIQTRRILRGILIAAVLVVLLAGTAMAIPAVRNAIIDYFFKDYEKTIGITFDPEAAANAPNEISETYSFGDIPTSFNLVLNEIRTDNVTFLWVNENGEMIVYLQHIMPDDPTDDAWMGIDIENSRKEMTLIGDYRVDIIRMQESYLLVWTNNAYFFTLQLPNSIDDEIMREIFLSWKPAEQE